jgi:hypothetical protein
MSTSDTVRIVRAFSHFHRILPTSPRTRTTSARCAAVAPAAAAERAHPDPGARANRWLQCR